ncbi:peptidylprolyl isomerase [Sphingomonas bacterium]|uniref:peptidylprolyl isomerase n=1 Tax=Sphingomonas bacterium TaxID=1895847 RepID=UPI0015765581|nr:peptidylprolyl isomerase [Sphingomonas bacterium]
MSTEVSNSSSIKHVGQAIRIGTALMLSLAMLSGCSKKPGGQVVAVVNAEDITQQELRAEAEAAGVPAGQDIQSFAPATLDRVIQRNLLADYAKSKNLDRGPEFVSRRRQMEQALLANLAMKQIVSSIGVPSRAEVSAFIAKNPSLFADRLSLTLDQVRFPAPSDPKQIKALASLGSLDAVLAKLKADGVPAARGTTAVDTGTIEASVSQQLTALPNGKLFDLTVNGVTYISTVIGRAPKVSPSSTWSAAAAGALQRERAQKTLTDEMAKLRAAAKIQYDPAFKPAAAAAK